LIRNAVRIGQTNERQPVAIAKGGGLFDGSHRDDGDVSAGIEESLVVISHVDHVLAAHRSPEVPDKQQHARLRLPK
jgi:hypothetical protein